MRFFRHNLWAASAVTVLALAAAPVHAGAIFYDPDPPELEVNITVSPFATLATGSQRSVFFAGTGTASTAAAPDPAGVPLVLQTNYQLSGLEITFTRYRRATASIDRVRAECVANCPSPTFALFDLRGGPSEASANTANNFIWDNLTYPFVIEGDKANCCGYSNGIHVIYLHPRRQPNNIFLASNDDPTTADVTAQFEVQLTATIMP